MKAGAVAVLSWQKTASNKTLKALSDEPNSLNIIRPDDWHAHFREGEMMRLALPHTTRVFARAIAMPNLAVPLTDATSCSRYRKALVDEASGGFEPLVTLYLNDATTPQTIAAAKPDAGAYDEVFGAKLYPKGATTGADHGVSDVVGLYPAFEEMQKRRLPLLLHGESVEADVDFYDREKVFIETTLSPMRKRFPELKIVLEHVTTREAVDFVRSENNTGATITPHHLLYTRNALFDGGLRPHRHCLPPAQRERDRAALIEAATGGEPCFFAGTDSAPHRLEDKCRDHGCAGVFNAPAAIETYAEIFELAGALNKLEAFTGVNGAAFYGLAQNTQRLRLVKQPWRVPEALEAGDLRVVPFRAGETVAWRASVQDAAAPQ